MNRLDERGERALVQTPTPVNKYPDFVHCLVQHPKAKDVNAFLGRTMTAVGKKPRYVITDKGKQFWCGGFKAWCRRRRDENLLEPRAHCSASRNSVGPPQQVVSSSLRRPTSMGPTAKVLLLGARLQRS